MFKYSSLFILTLLLVASYAYAQDDATSVELFDFGEIIERFENLEQKTSSPASEIIVLEPQSSSFLTAPSFFDGIESTADVTIMEPEKTNIILPPRRPKKLKASQAYLNSQEEKRTDGNAAFSDLSSRDILSHIEPSSGKEVKNDRIKVEAKPMRSKRSETISVPYVHDEYKFEADARTFVSGEILTKAFKEPNNKIKLYAYASKADKTDVEAKRLSLRRALDIRDFLVSKDVDSKRIAIFPMGYKHSTTEQSNRFDKVDVVFSDS